MKPLTAFEIRILANMTDDQLVIARDNLLAIERPWTMPETRAALAFANEHQRRVDGKPVHFTGPSLQISGNAV